MAPTAFAQQKPKPKPAAAATGDKPLDKKQLAEAKQHYTDGDTKFKAGDFDGALKDFQAADGIKATPQTARYIGACLDSLGRFQEALDAYQRFLSNVPPKMAMMGDQIKLRVAAIQALPGKLHVTSSPSEVGFSLDGKPQPMPTPADVEVPPGHHTLHFTAPGHDPVDKDVDVTFASKQELAVTLPASAAPPPPPPAPIAAATPPPPAEPAAAAAPAAAPAPHSNTAAWITGGAAVIAVGIGSVFGVMALNDKSNFNADPTTATADSGENHALIADMSFGVAVTLGVTSLVLFLSKDEAPAAPAATTTSEVTRKRDEAKAKKPSSFTITPSPIITAHGAGAGALIRF
ncbi:MAG: PEGA domain-containing protein [Polyangiaceae bacterium]